MAASRPAGGRTHVELGAAGEVLVAALYERAGYRVLDRNWRCRDGEIDLIVGHGRLVVFCEVKTRSGTGFGVPAAAVHDEKQRRIRRLAATWLREHGGGRDLRFDVASVVWPSAGEPTVEVVEGAF